MDIPGDPTVVVTDNGPVRLLRINRPHRANAYDRATNLALARALADAERDDAVAAVVLTGTGSRAFCAGQDLRALASEDQALVPGEGGFGELLRERFYEKPVVAAVNGAAVGGGFELALACDLLVASQTATFALPEVSLGLVAAAGGVRLSNRIPVAVAMDLLLMGRTLTAQEALSLGLVNRVVARHDVLATALDVASAIARHPASAVRATRRLLLGEIGAFDEDRWLEIIDARRAMLARTDGSAARRPTPGLGPAE